MNAKLALLSLFAALLVTVGCGGDAQPFGGEASQNGRGDSGAVGGSVAGTGGAVGTGGAGGAAMTGAGGRNTFCDSDPCAQQRMDQEPNGFICSCHADSKVKSGGYCQCDLPASGSGGAGGSSSATGTGGAVAAGGSSGTGGTSGAGGATSDLKSCTDWYGWRLTHGFGQFCGVMSHGSPCHVCSDIPASAGAVACAAGSTVTCVDACSSCSK